MGCRANRFYRSRSSFVLCPWLFVTGYWLVVRALALVWVIGCWLLVSSKGFSPCLGCWLLVIGYWLLGGETPPLQADCRLPKTHCLLPKNYCRLPIADCPLEADN